MIKHIGFIMDGNRRWAREKNVPLLEGHKQGITVLEKTIAYAVEKHIPYVTFWAFSTENWKRGETEVNLLMQVFRWGLAGPLTKRLIKNGVQLQILGDIEAFPADIKKNLLKLVAQTKNNTNITVNIALNYGGRQEILRVVNALLLEKKEDVDEQTFSSYLYTGDQPDPDLIVRTGGEQRLSGFLPWQSIYSELYFTDTYWPGFDEQAFEKALAEFESRNRRFGK
jgi:undecaprenyl diphosphate synthase